MSVDSMELQINERMKKWDASFKLGLKPLSPQEILKGLVTVGITDSFAGEGLELEQYGSGFQRSLICEIINVKAGLTTRLKRSDSMRLLIFEEPEAFLHSDQQSELARSLMKIAEDGTQVVCTSHAQTFVSRKMADVTGIVRLVKDAGVTNAYQMDEKQWNELKRPVSPYPDKLQTYITRTTLELDEYRYRCWLDGSRADAFFASHVLLVEGATESALISRLVDERKLNLPHGTVVVDCLGKYNYFRFIRLMYAYGIKIVVVIDSDSGKKGEELEKHNAWNSFVKEEVARSGDRAAFWAIPEDLERYLSIKSVAAKGDDLKPYNMLNEYEAGRYDKDKLRSFCTKLEELFAK